MSACERSTRADHWKFGDTQRLSTSNVNESALGVAAGRSVGVGVIVGVIVGVEVRVGVGWSVPVAVGVGVMVNVGVIGVGVSVGTGVGGGTRQPLSHTAANASIARRRRAGRRRSIVQGTQ